MAAVPQIGRATHVERPVAPGVDAAGDLYARYSEQIFGYCHHQLGSREEAEDAVQTTFMNALRGLQRGVVPELESAWLFKIAHNVCLSRRRSSWRRGKVESPNNFEVLQEVVAGPDHAADELIRLQEVLEGMPEHQRRAILLREWQGLTYREISTELGLTQAAVETLIFRARRALAQGLEQDADTWKRRLRRGADVGGVIAFMKALLGGGGAAAVKVTATAAIAVATTAVVAATDGPMRGYHLSLGKQPAPKTIHVTRDTAARTSAATSTTPAQHATSRAVLSMSSGQRGLLKPVTLAAQVESTTDTPTAPSSAPAPTPTPEPAQTAPTPPPAATAAPAPAPSEAAKRDDRTPQATTQPTETTPTPPPTPTPAPSAGPPGQPDQATDTGKPDKPAKPDKPEKPAKDK